MTPTLNLFVYGTLRSGQFRNDVLGNSKLVGTGITNGVLYDLGPFPGAKFSGKKSLTGDVYEINQETLSTLDFIESNGYLFERKIVHVLVNNEYRECWAYEFLPNVKEEMIVKTGDYLNQ